MKIGKTLALAAVSGMVLGAYACGGEAAVGGVPTVPSGAPSAMPTDSSAIPAPPASGGAMSCSGQGGKMSCNAGTGAKKN